MLTGLSKALQRTIANNVTIKTHVALPRDIRRLSVRAQNVRIACHRPRRPLRMLFQLWMAWSDSCKTIYRWIREEISGPMVKSGSGNLKVRRQFRGSRVSRMRPFSVRIAILWTCIQICKFSSFGETMHTIDGWKRLDKTNSMILVVGSETSLPAR